MKSINFDKGNMFIFDPSDPVQDKMSQNINNKFKIRIVR